MEKWKRTGWGETTVFCKLACLDLHLLESESSAYLVRRGEKKLEIYFSIQTHNWNVHYLLTQARTNAAQAWKKKKKKQHIFSKKLCVDFEAALTASVMCVQGRERAKVVRLRDRKLHLRYQTRAEARTGPEVHLCHQSRAEPWAKDNTTRFPLPLHPP